MKSIISFSVLCYVAALGSVAVAREGGSLDPTGTWLVEDGRAKIKIEKCGADQQEICGNIVWLKDPLDEKGHQRTDLKNPDPAKRSRPTLGMPLFVDLKPDEDQIYEGQIYNAENGKEYDVTLHVDKPQDLRVKGCVLAVLCGSQHWTRIADVAPAGAVVATTQTKSKIKPAPAE